MPSFNKDSAAALAASLLVGLAAAAPMTAQAQPTIARAAPADTAPVVLLKQLMSAATTGDDAASLAAVRGIWPTAPFSEQDWPHIRPLFQRLQYHGVERATASEAEATAYDPQADGWAHLVVQLKPDAPGVIANLDVQLGPTPHDIAPPPKLQPAELAAATAAKLKQLEAEDRFSGAVLVAHGGKAVFSQAYGLADRSAKTANTVDTQFRFGSMGKMFTAVAVMQLVQQGKLQLAAPIGRYLPDYPNKEVAAKVTLNQLLTHTAGVGDIFGPEFEAHRLELRELKDYVALYGARPPEFEPGQGRAYSNYGFILMGRIVEQVSGLSYDDYLQRNIFAPAGMAATGNQPETVRLPRRAVGYTGGPLRDAADTLPWRGTSAGGGYSTVGDLLRFANALMANRLLDAEHTRLLTEGETAGPSGGKLRYDFGGMTPDGKRFFGHGGGAPGMNGQLQIFPDQGYTVVVLANRDPPIAGVVGKFVSDRLP